MSEIKFKSPCSGKVINIEEFPDEIISDKAMGDGFGVYLDDNLIVSPFNGVVKVLYPTGHAICLTSDDGIDLMIHIGIDSFSISGLNKIYVKVGDKVKQGDKLIKTNIRKLEKLTGNTATAIVFLNQEKVIDLKVNQNVDNLDQVAIIEVD